MFGISTDKETIKTNGVTVLTEGCHFAGKLFCRGDSKVSGRVDGEIIAEGTLILEPSALLNAKITGKKIVIKGTVHGEILEADHVELTKTAAFYGNIRCKSLSIETGANFCGTTQMQPPKQQDVDKELLSTYGEKTSTLPSNYEIQSHENHGVRPSLIGEEVENNYSDSYMAS